VHRGEQRAVRCRQGHRFRWTGLPRTEGLPCGRPRGIPGGAAGRRGRAGTAGRTDPAAQLASASGARVIAATREEDARWCRECGADEVVDHRDPGALAEVARLAPDGVDVFWDNSGRHDLERTVPLLARRGRMIVLAGLHAMPVLPVGALYTRDASLRGFAISNASAAELAAAARAVNHGLARGVLRSRIGVRLPLTEAAEAHRLQEQGGAATRGRIVVLP
jgi:NADPH:quinone reductase-like Zn-dependent oxidoreductase